VKSQSGKESGQIERERRGINQITIKQIILSHFTHLLVERKRRELYAQKKVKKQHHHRGESEVPIRPPHHTHTHCPDIKTGEKREIFV